MITIQQTIEIPVSHKLTIDIPTDIPAGRTQVILTFPLADVSEKKLPESSGTNAFRNTLLHTFPTIAEMKAEAARMAEDRQARIEASGIDPLQKFCGSMKSVFDDDGTVIQRGMRDEWPD